MTTFLNRNQHPRNLYRITAEPLILTLNPPPIRYENEQVEDGRVNQDDLVGLSNELFQVIHHLFYFLVLNFILSILLFACVKTEAKYFLTYLGILGLAKSLPAELANLLLELLQRHFLMEGRFSSKLLKKIILLWGVG